MAVVVLLTAAVLILSFLSSSVIPKAITVSVVRSLLSSSIGHDAIVLSATGTFSVVFLEKLKLICTFVGDTFGDSMPESVFLVFVVGCADRGSGGTLIVTDADVFVFVMPICPGCGDGIVNVAVFVSAFDVADDGAVSVYDATIVSVVELDGMDTVFDTIGVFTDAVTLTLSSDDDLIVGIRSLVVMLVFVVVVVVAVVVVDVVLVAEFSF